MELEEETMGQAELATTAAAAETSLQHQQPGTYSTGGEISRARRKYGNTGIQEKAIYGQIEIPEPDKGCLKKSTAVDGVMNANQREQTVHFPSESQLEEHLVYSQTEIESSQDTIDIDELMNSDTEDLYLSKNAPPSLQTLIFQNLDDEIRRSAIDKMKDTVECAVQSVDVIPGVTEAEYNEAESKGDEEASKKNEARNKVVDEDANKIDKATSASKEAASCMGDMGDEAASKGNDTNEAESEGAKAESRDSAAVTSRDSGAASKDKEAGSKSDDVVGKGDQQTVGELPEASQKTDNEGDDAVDEVIHVGLQDKTAYEDNEALDKNNEVASKGDEAASKGNEAARRDKEVASRESETASKDVATSQDNGVGDEAPNLQDAEYISYTILPQLKRSLFSSKRWLELDDVTSKYQLDSEEEVLLSVAATDNINTTMTTGLFDEGESGMERERTVPTLSKETGDDKQEDVIKTPDGQAERFPDVVTADVTSEGRQAERVPDVAAADDVTPQEQAVGVPDDVVAADLVTSEVQVEWVPHTCIEVDDVVKDVLIQTVENVASCLDKEQVRDQPEDITYSPLSQVSAEESLFDSQDSLKCESAATTLEKFTKIDEQCTNHRDECLTTSESSRPKKRPRMSPEDDSSYTEQRGQIFHGITGTDGVLKDICGQGQRILIGNVDYPGFVSASQASSFVGSQESMADGRVVPNICGTKSIDVERIGKDMRDKEGLNQAGSTPTSQASAVCSDHCLSQELEANGSLAYPSDGCHQTNECGYMEDPEQSVDIVRIDHIDQSRKRQHDSESDASCPPEKVLKATPPCVTVESNISRKESGNEEYGHALNPLAVVKHAGDDYDQEVPGCEVKVMPIDERTMFEDQCDKKIYSCDMDILDEKDSPVCQSVDDYIQEKPKNPSEPLDLEVSAPNVEVKICPSAARSVFQWNHTSVGPGSSCIDEEGNKGDHKKGDAETTPALVPLQRVRVPLRLGLSRRQSVRPLHPNLKR